MAFIHAITLGLLVSVLGVPALAAQTTDPVPPHESFTIQSQALREPRRINVHLPAGYATDTRASFPVLYMPDGGLDEDFPHVVNTVDSLALLGDIRPVIVVGIPNTERRRDLTGPTTVGSDSTIAARVGWSGAFRAFIRDELMPEIRRRYRTTSETSIVGESLAGLFVVETFLEEPRLFRHYIALSPSVWWNDGASVRTAGFLMARRNFTGSTLFLSAANEQDIASGTAALADTLRARSPTGLTVHYRPRPDLEHSTIFRGEGPEAFGIVLR